MMNKNQSAALEIYKNEVAIKFQLYNGLFTALPFHKIERTGNLLAMLLMVCEDGYQNKKIEDLVSLSAKQRYEKLRHEHPIYLQKLSNKQLASYLDISQETLSRLKSK